MKWLHSIALSMLFVLTLAPALAQAPDPQTQPQEPATAHTPVSSVDAVEAACKDVQDLTPVKVSDIRKIVEAQFESLKGETDKDKIKQAQTVSDSAILGLLQNRRLEAPATAEDILDLVKHNASSAVLNAITNGPEVYIGWSVIPSKIVTDNYGHYVRRKYFAIDVAIANRSKDSLIVNALEFCNSVVKLRDVTSDPTLVRGSLQKGELTGTRTIVVGAIQAIGGLASPSAVFFKNQIHRGTFSGIASLFNPLKTGYDLVWPDTILTYLQNWDKDEVFKKGFVVSAGGSTRGRVFIPIEVIYPRPVKIKDDSDREALKSLKMAVEGNFDIKEVKTRIGKLVVLGQAIELKNQQRFVNSE